MKQLLVFLFILPICAKAQTIIHKPVKIFDGGSSMMAAGNPHVVTLSRIVEGLDSTYAFTFDDQEYSELTVIKSIEFNNKEELRAFAKTLRMAQSSNFSERVANNYAGNKKGYIVSKEKIGLGGTSFQIFTDGGYCYLNTKKTEKLLKVIDNE
jgi:hypothetical protein